ncbi:EamA/RhaT family transporter [Streptomyces sp. NPDC051173]|uniref:EamA/RhaT family transporter n=1 Tax=Streptomyces sp. NPDC051173 TaxID=3155164 RepID=UPI00344C3528
MSDESEATGPRPEPIRFFGTTWVDHDGGYALRRVGAGVGALVTAAAGALVLRFGYEGLTIAKVGNLVNILVAVAFAVCTALAFRRTWEGFSRRPDHAADASAERSMQSMLLIGFIGSLLAYALRTLTEAPGENLRRKEYEEALVRYERRRAKSGKRGKRR